ncbi:hypothetical protein RO3G_11071 [Lichtheimia corymbifera JMRC:FSU:9682]|uniref:SH3 domain-containing protein n=1 Tax=Lichtheimia corymbifera JMRC:FSU:9682 TaxID=1263082 RepID=A0A068SBJ3_9FUNG|nr:hypothetical protein RO3G_11071 [Lichtheimia corymbifera JMRC:FSU:9682]
MSLSTAITLALLLKKFARKGGSISKRTFRSATKKDSGDTRSDHTSAASSYTSQEKTSPTKDLDLIKPPSLRDYSAPPSPPPQSDDPIKDDEPAVQEPPSSSTKSSNSVRTSHCTAAFPVLIRDFAYPESSPLHYGQPVERRTSIVSLSSSEFNGCQARALYDFVPETEYEIGMKAGDVVWVQYRQCPGWLIADVEDDTGLIPETYVEFI